MTEKHINDKGFTYILLAIICLIVFFIGFEIINNKNNSIGDNTINLEIENNKLVKKDTTKFEKTYFIENDGFYLKTIVNSHSFMKYIYDSNIDNEKSNVFSSFISKIFSPTTYIKSQLPGIINVVDSIETSSSDSNDNGVEIKIIDDINLVSSETNNEDNDNIHNEEDSDNESENLENVKYEDIIFIDPYDDEDIEKPTEGSVIDNETLEVLASSVNKLNVNEDKPYIMIYHTHGQESYLPATDDNFHTTNRDYNVTKIGKIVSDGLKEKGHNLVYIDKFHDIPMKESYSNAYKTLSSNLNKESNLKVLIDIHRDGISGSYEKVLKERGIKERVTINDVSVATFSLVIGPNNLNKNKLIELAEYIKLVSDRMYPGLCSRIIVKEYGKFNQSISDHSLLIEVGSNKNTVEEAAESAKLISEVLDKAIHGILAD